MKYNKLVIFDLDGVLIESRAMHYLTLNKALEDVAGPSFMINYGDHLARFDGLPTRKKLAMLTEEKGLDPELYDEIYLKKQLATKKELLKLPNNYNLMLLFGELRNRGFKIAVASNAITETVEIAVHVLGLRHYIDHISSNQDVTVAKPYPEIYWQCMQACNAVPDTTVIIEDSHIGREGALASKAHLIPVENPDYVISSYILPQIEKWEKAITDNVIPWRKDKLNVLIPMAGAGSRFAAAGYTFPKPLIEVRNEPMIQVVVENLNMDAHFIYLVQREHYEKYNLKYMLNLLTPGCDVVLVDGLTEGAACTTLLAESLIDNDTPLVIANSDQYVEWNSNEVMYAFSGEGIDGGILAFHSTHPKWSYVSLDENGFAKEVAEKKVISDNATVGIYYWSKGSDYVKYTKEMIAANDRTNNEFYVAPTFNYAIRDGKKIRVKYAQEMWGLGTPEDLNYFLSHHKEEK